MSAKDGTEASNANFLRRIHPLAFAGAAAFLLTVFAYFFDTRSQENLERNGAQAVLSQLVAQSDALYYHAKSKGEIDPVGYTVQFFSIGKEPRPFRVKKIDPQTNPRAPTGPQEEFIANENSGKYEIRKKLDSERNEGVLIEYQIQPLNFLGARGTLSGDFRAALFFFLVFFSIGLFVQNRLEQKEVRLAVDLKQNLGDWVKNAKQTLNSLSRLIKDTMDSAQALDGALGSPKQMLEGLAKNIHNEINQVHEIRKTALQAEKISALSQLQLLKFIKATQNSPEACLTAQNLEAQFEALRELQNTMQKSLKNLEMSLEPWAMDADLSFQAYDNSIKLSKELRAHLRETTKTLMNQAQSVRALDSIK